MTDTEKMPAENYLEIGNRLPYRKNYFGVSLVIFLVRMVCLSRDNVLLFSPFSRRPKKHLPNPQKNGKMLSSNFHVTQIKPSLTKPPFPILRCCRFFSRADRPHVPLFHLRLHFSCVLQVSTGVPGTMAGADLKQAIECPTPRYEQDDSQPLATSPDNLPARTAKRLYSAASQGQLGKAWRQLRAPPPVFVGPDQWNEALAKFTPHERPEGPPIREDLASETWHRTPREFDQAIAKLKKHKVADAGGWTTEAAQSCLNRPRLKTTCLLWIHGQAVSTNILAGLARAHRLVGLHKGGGTLWSKFLSHLLLKHAKSDLNVFFLRDRQSNYLELEPPGA